MRLNKNSAYAIITAFLIIIVSTPAMAVLLSDQGTGVSIKSNGMPVDDGNLTVQIWDNPSSGSPIYNYTFVEAINNGSWDLTIGDSPGPSLNLSYGQTYYKDYLINGEDATFTDNTGSPVGRLKFQSPLGPINATQYITGLSVVTNETDPIWTSVAGNYYNKTETEALVQSVNLSGNISQFFNDVGYLTTDTLQSLSCGSNQIVVYNGTEWVCDTKPVDGSDITINSVVDNNDGTYTWQFSDGTNYTTSDLTGPQGPQGPQGNQGNQGLDGYSVVTNVSSEPAGAQCSNGGYKIDFYRDTNNDGIFQYLTDFPLLGTAYSCEGDQGAIGPAGPQGPTGADGVNGTSVTINNVLDNGDGTFEWQFSDGTNYTTSNLTGAQGPQGLQGIPGINGTDGANLTLTNIIDNNDGTYTWAFSDGTNYTTSNLTGDQGPAGADGINGTDGVNGTTFDTDGIYLYNNGSDVIFFNDSALPAENDPLFTAWGYNWNNLTNIPAGFADGTDNDTTYSNLSEFINDAGYLTNETDPVFGSSASYTITAINISNWNEVYSWGDHSLAGYLTTETDPLFVAANNTLARTGNCPTGQVAQNTTTQGVECVEVSFNESDPVFLASPAFLISNTNITNWNEAYSWGDHSLAGYLTTETDPTFQASPASSISNLQVTNWDTAYTWGDHSLAGYLTTETDPVWTSVAGNYVQFTNTTLWDKNASDDFSGSWNDLNNIPIGFADNIDNDTTYENVSEFANDAGYLTSYTETDPLFTAWGYDWNNLTNVPAGFADGIDNDTQLNESQVDAFVDNNDYLVSGENATTGSINITGSNNCVNLANGGKLCGELANNGKECTIIYSPDGNNKVQVCNN